MNTSEHELLRQTAATVEELRRALMDPDPISGKSFVERTADVVDRAEKGSWAFKWGVRFILGAGALVAALSGIWNFVK